MKLKKALAATLSVFMLGGTIGYNMPEIGDIAIVADAEDATGECYTFDSTTGLLTLKGEVVLEEIKNFEQKDDVKSIKAAEGTVFPLNCSSIFKEYGNCVSIDLSNVDTSNVIYMVNMFNLCKSLTSIDLSSFDTSKVTNMSGMFQYCEKLESLDIGSFDTSNVEDMQFMFNGCKSLTSIDLSSFDTSKVTNMSGMFQDCEKLESLDLSSFDTSNVKAMQFMFNGCKSLTSIDLSSFDTSNVEDMEYMFHYCYKLTSLDLSSFDTGNVEDMSRMFYMCHSLTLLDLSRFDTSKVKNMSYMFAYCALTSLDLSGFDTSNVTGMDHMFYYCGSLASLDLSGFDTSKVTDMSYMFCQCHQLTSLDLRTFDTSNVTNMECMFQACFDLISLDLSSFDTSSVETMKHMFYQCEGLTSLDLSGFDTSSVLSMNSMFYDCHSLTSLDVSSFDTSNVVDMISMFDRCRALTSLDVSSFDTSKVKDVTFMFWYCESLTSLDLRGFDTSNVKNMEGMFCKTPQLVRLIVGENFKNITAIMQLSNEEGSRWVNAKDTFTVVSGSGNYAVINNDGENVYYRLGSDLMSYPEIDARFIYDEIGVLSWHELEGAAKYRVIVTDHETGEQYLDKYFYSWKATDDGQITVQIYPLIDVATDKAIPMDVTLYATDKNGERISTVFKTDPYYEYPIGVKPFISDQSPSKVFFCPGDDSVKMFVKVSGDGYFTYSWCVEHNRDEDYYEEEGEIFEYHGLSGEGLTEEDFCSIVTCEVGIRGEKYSLHSENMVLWTVEKGDVNCDGSISIADLVLLQNWLLAKPDAELQCWSAADICDDDRIDAFDLVMLRKMLIKQQ